MSQDVWADYQRTSKQMQTITLFRNEEFHDYYHDEKGEDILCTGRVKQFFFWFRRPKKISVTFSKEAFPGAKKFFFQRQCSCLEWNRSGDKNEGYTLLSSTIPYLAEEFGDAPFVNGDFDPIPVWVSIKKL